MSNNNVEQPSNLDRATKESQRHIGPSAYIAVIGAAALGLSYFTGTIDEAAEPVLRPIVPDGVFEADYDPTSHPQR